MTIELNEGTIAGILGEWYRDSDGYSEAVDSFHTWVEEQREDAHLQALAGASAQLLLREDYMAITGQDETFVRGYREARYKIQHILGTLSTTYKNRRRFAARDAEKAVRAHFAAEKVAHEPESE